MKTTQKVGKREYRKAVKTCVVSHLALLSDALQEIDNEGLLSIDRKAIITSVVQKEIPEFVTWLYNHA